MVAVKTALALALTSFLLPACAHLPGFLQPAFDSELPDDDPYNLYCCTSSNTEVENEIMLNVTRGAVPAFLKGDLLKMGGGKFEVGPRRFGHQFDAFAKIHKFRFAGDGTVGFTARFVQSKFYNDSIKAGNIVPGLLMASTEPPFKMAQFYEAFLNLPDNTLINVWAVGDDRIVTNTDFAKYNEIDRKTLATRGAFDYQDKFNNLVGKVIPTMTCAHTQYIGGGGSVKGGRTSINFIGNISPGLTGIGMDITLYRQLWGSNKRDAISETHHLDWVPLIHSFGVTDKYAVFLIHPEQMKLQETLKHAGPAATSAITWHGDLPTKVLVLDLEHAQDETLPGSLPAFQVFEVPSFFSVHHVNTYQDGDKLVAQVVCYDNGDFFSPGAGIGMVAVERNKTKRLGRPSPKYCNVEVDLTAGKATVEKRVSGIGASGDRFGMEMPRYNDEWQGKKTCFFYGISMFLDNAKKWASNFTQSIMKTNVCDNGPGNAVAYTKNLHFGWEPVFVPNGGPAEDDGVLLVVSMDGERRTSYLVILDAKDMTEVAVVYLPDGLVMPNQLHSRYFSYADFPLPSAAERADATYV